MNHVISAECICCDVCARECPEDAVSEGKNKYEIDNELCTDCGICVSLCPIKAISNRKE